jgi:outer membrane protein
MEIQGTEWFARSFRSQQQGSDILMKSLQSYVSALCVLLMAAPGMYAQDTNAKIGEQGSSSRFGGFLKKYEGESIAPISMSNSGRLEQLVRAGKLYLSLQDAICAALENNIDIEIQRYGFPLAATDVLRAKAGQSLRIIPSAVSQGSAGATGSGVTGTTTGNTQTGGTQTNAVINGNQGSPIYPMDPALTGTLSWGHFSVPQSSPFLTGSSSLVQRSNTYNFGVQQGFLTGTLGQLNFSNSIVNQNNLRNDINPVIAANAEIYVQQHLLQGFGIAINNRNIRIAKNNVQVADLVFKQQVINTVANVVGLYWDLVAFNEDVRVKKEALSLSQKLYGDNKKQVEIGTLAPIEIVRAEAEVASREQDLTVSETRVLQQETIIKNAISRNGVASPTIAEVNIVPTDKIEMPPVEAIEPIQDLVAKAINLRPELGQTQIQLDNSRIALKGTKNALLPTIDAYVDLRNRGQAGSINTQPIIDGSGNLVPRNPANVNSFFLGGYGTALDQLFSRNFPDYSAGLQLTIPLRNRAAQADYATAQLQLRQAELQYQRQVNNVRVDVQNALIALQQARAQYSAAEKTRVLQEQTLDAEQKKYALGASTVFLVIQAQRDLATAEGNRVLALDAYARARTQLDLALGSTLDVTGVHLDEAQKGSVSRPPSPLPVLDNSGPGRAANPTAATPVAAKAPAGK